MADVARSRAANIANFPDNTVGANSAQDQRDFIASAFGCYGELRVTAGVTAQAGIGVAPAKMTGWDTNGAAQDTTPDHTADEITVDVAGTYLVLLLLSLSALTATALYRLEVYKNGVATGQAVEILSNAAPDRVVLASAGLLAIAAADVISVYVNSDGAARTMTPTEGQLVLKMVG